MSKASPARIIRNHRRSYAHAATGRRLVADHLLFEGLPLAVGAGALAAGADLPAAMTLTIAGAAGLVAAMMFAAMLFVTTHAARIPARMRELNHDRREWSRRRRFLEEVLANAAYGTLAALALLAALCVGLGPDPLWRADALALGLAAHTALIAAMVMKRMMALGESTLDDALAVREPQPAEDAVPV